MSQTDKVSVNVSMSEVLNAVHGLEVDITQIKTTLVGIGGTLDAIGGRFDTIDKKIDKLDERVTWLERWVIGILATALLVEPAGFVLLHVFHVI